MSELKTLPGEPAPAWNEEAKPRLGLDKILPLDKDSEYPAGHAVTQVWRLTDAYGPYWYVATDTHVLVATQHVYPDAAEPTTNIRDGLNRMLKKATCDPTPITSSVDSLREFCGPAEWARRCEHCNESGCIECSACELRDDDLCSRCGGCGLVQCHICDGCGIIDPEIRYGWIAYEDDDFRRPSNPPCLFNRNLIARGLEVLGATGEAKLSFLDIKGAFGLALCAPEWRLVVMGMQHDVGTDTPTWKAVAL
jgi:hypothetical protein